MKVLQSKKSYFLILGVLFSIISCPLWASEFVLKDFIDADKRIANHRPSQLIAPVTGDFIKMRGKWYQVRFFIFETTDCKNKPSGDYTFEKYIKENELLYLGATDTFDSLFPGYYFIAGLAQRKKNSNFMISVRPIDDIETIADLEKPKALAKTTNDNQIQANDNSSD